MRMLVAPGLRFRAAEREFMSGLPGVCFSKARRKVAWD